MRKTETSQKRIAQYAPKIISFKNKNGNSICHLNKIKKWKKARQTSKNPLQTFRQKTSNFIQIYAKSIFIAV